MKRIEQLIERVRREQVPDHRSGVFDVQLEQRGGKHVLVGQTTAPDAVQQVLAAAGDALHDEVLRLPDPALGEERFGVVSAAVAPVYLQPALPAPQISQLVMGMRVDLLERRGGWLRIRGEDGYLGWVNQGYVQRGTEEWAHAWERGSDGEPVVSIGAELIDEEGRALARLPWGARILRYGGLYHTPDGRAGSVGSGEVVDVDRLADRFPARGESIARTARRWFGTPYLWGGVTLAGADCSGYTQAVCWMHGIALPRDSDLQARVGVELDAGEEFEQLRAGDLLFFAEESDGRVTHVAFSLGRGHIVHSALSNGGVLINDLTGSLPLEERLRRTFTHARRLLPD